MMYTDKPRRVFGDNATATRTLDSIRGYDPTLAHWAYNGNARRYWDFTTAGKIAQIERMIHHYGSSLNALALLDSYRYNAFPSSPSALYDLRVGYGGNLAALSNHQRDGFASVAFHSYPDLLRWDPYSGDHGLGFLGNIIGSSTVLVDASDYGWVSFGGNVDASGTTITCYPRDTVRRRVYIAARGLFVEVDAGQITSFSYDTSSHSITVMLAAVSGSKATNATLTFKSTLGEAVTITSANLGEQRGGTAVSIPDTITFS